MGFSPSPYFVIKNMLVIEDVIRGYGFDEHNIFQWDHVVLNLFGMLGYNPSSRWVFKVSLDGSIAVDLYFYIDDGRSTTGTVWDCWKASRKTCCTLIHHRLQFFAGCRKKKNRS